MRAAGITLGEEDEKRFIDWIKERYRPGSSGWWRKVAAEGDLPDHVKDWREQRDTTPDGRTAWCGSCDERTRMREDAATAIPERCPACHPRLSARSPGRSKRAGYQPYRNPVDPERYYLDDD